MLRDKTKDKQDLYTENYKLPLKDIDGEVHPVHGQEDSNLLRSQFPRIDL